MGFNLSLVLNDFLSQQDPESALTDVGFPYVFLLSLVNE